LYAFFGFVDA
jgi:hypothetical protein